jgi:transcriptional regulator with XRE-family HTH domain
MQTIVYSAIWELFVSESGHKDTELLVLGRALREMREQRGMSPDELADAAGMSRRRIDALETGHVDPSYELLLALANGLGIRPSALVILAEQLNRASE